jgi:glycosyltransferase involved in cell wall biosynthesis
MNVSVVIPIYNERENLEPLHEQLRAALDYLGDEYELIFVDDGSRDGSRERLAELAAADPRVRAVLFRRNYGQTAAMQAGLEHARGAVVVTLDGDLQNDPQDIPKLVAKLDEGYDLAHGWRVDRQDAWLHRKLPSRIANRLISWATQVPIHDLGCTLKAMRRDIAQELELYGQMHRFIPILAAARGARCIEVATRHHPRRFGTSKYGISRTLQVMLDLCTVKYMQSYFANPMRLFGRWAAYSGLAGMMLIASTLLMKLLGGVDMTGNPLLLLGVFAMLSSIQLLSLGLLGEVSARLYYQRDGHRPFAIAARIGFPEQAEVDLVSLRRAA